MRCQFQAGRIKRSVFDASDFVTHFMIGIIQPSNHPFIQPSIHPSKHLKAYSKKSRVYVHFMYNSRYKASIDFPGSFVILSAVTICDFFTTSRRQDPGVKNQPSKRLTPVATRPAPCTPHIKRLDAVLSRHALKSQIVADASITSISGHQRHIYQPSTGKNRVN